MKRSILVLLVHLCLATAYAAPPTTTFVVTTQTVSIPAGGYTVSFSVNWFGDDYPQSSAPGRVELHDAGGNLLGRVTASHYQSTGVSTFASLGYLTDVVSSVNIYAADGSPADGQLNAQWHITGVPAGTYTLRFFEYTTWASPLQATTVWTKTTSLDGWPSGSPPTIAWLSAPMSAANGEGYYVAAHGNDADGNLAQVNVWKNGQPFAFAGGGNGTDGDSGNWTSDGGPQTVTFTAQAVDADGATSPVITHTVTINAVVNQPPAVTLLAPGAQTVTAGTTLTISARATDPDGNLSGHNLDIQRPAGDWNYQGGFATGEPYQGGPVGSGADSTRTASFTFTDVGTYNVRSGAYDGSGWYHSATVAITVTPANRAPTIAWLSAPASASHQQSYTISARGSDADGNLSQVNLWKNGQPFAFAGGGSGFSGDSGNPTSDNGLQTITFTAQAVDADGATSPVITHIITIDAPVNNPPTVTLLSPGGQNITAGTTLTISSHATDPDGNITNHNLDIQRPAGDWNFQGGFATGEPYQGGPVGSGADSTRTASFTFTDVGTYSVRSGAYDGSGWYHSATVAITVTPANRAPTLAWLSAPASASHQQSYTISARGSDADGNLSQVNLWKNGQPFAFAGGGSGFSGDSGNPTSDNGPQTITFTAQAVDADGATSPVITHIITIDAPVNNPPTVTLLSPVTQTIVAGTTLSISSHATDSDGNITSHNLDIQRPAGDWNYQGGFATGEPYQGGPAGSGADSTRTASFTFSDVGTYYVRSAADDGSGWVHSATVAITVTAPPPVQYSLITVAGAGGTVSPGGTYNAGTTVTVNASADSTHDFAGWSGDAGGATNPLGVLIDRDKTVQANFAPKSFSLITSASGGGNVTPGGNYPYGATVTVTAAADATHRFVGWAGDASGNTPTIALTVTQPLAVQAVFEPKTIQTIAFPSVTDQSVGTSFPLSVAASSGLPVTLVVTGPANYANGTLTLTGPGAVSIQATQSGDGYYLPATPVTRTFNAAAAAVLKYRTAARTLLQTGRTSESIPYVIQTNP